MSCKAAGLCTSKSCCDSSCYGPRSSCRPPRDTFSKQVNKPFQSETVYCMSYQRRCCDGRQPPARMVFNGPKTIGQPVEGSTITHLSYTNPGGRPAQPLYPRCRDVISHCNCNRYLVTTQKHDYVPKPLFKLLPLKLPEPLRSFEEPMAADTVASASYLPVCARVSKELNACTRRAAETPPCARPPFAAAGDTVQRRSYQPAEPSTPDPQSWRLNCYARSPMPFDGATTYRKSFLPPC